MPHTRRAAQPLVLSKDGPRGTSGCPQEQDTPLDGWRRGLVLPRCVRQRQEAPQSEERVAGHSQSNTYLSMLTGGARTLVASAERFPTEAMMFSPSDFSLSTKLSTSFPFAPSFKALLGPEGLNKRWTNVQVSSGHRLLLSHHSGENMGESHDVGRRGYVIA